MKIDKFTITKKDALELFDSASDMARQLGVSPGAVGQYPIDANLPQVHADAIRWYIKPEHFGGCRLCAG